MTMDSASITLVPLRATLSFAHSLSAIAARTISVGALLEPGTDVRLPTERSLKDADWTVTFTEAAIYNDHATELGAIGFLKYWPERHSVDNPTPEACHASAALTLEVFGTLLSALQNGRLPKAIHIDAKGLEWGWEPDGCGVVWNVEATNALPITEIRFNLPLLAEVERAPSSDPWGISLVSDHHPSTTHDINSLEKTLVAALAQLETRLTRISISAIVIAALLLFFHH